MFLGVGGLAALITALFEFTFSYLAQVNTILILNYSYWKTTLYALSIAIRHFQFEGENQAITLHNLSAKMCRKIFRFLNKITNLCLAQKSEYIFYKTEVGNGSIWLGKFWKIPCFGMTLWTCIWYECNFIQPCKGVGLVGVVHPPSSPIEKGRKYSQKITFLLLMTDKSCDMWEARFEIWSL